MDCYTGSSSERWAIGRSLVQIGLALVSFQVYSLMSLLSLIT
jgi:hypothetical protein